MSLIVILGDVVLYGTKDKCCPPVVPRGWGTTNSDTMENKKFTDPYIRHYPAPDKRVEVPDGGKSGLYLRVTPSGHKSFVYRYRFGHEIKRYTIGTFPKISLTKARDEADDLYQKVKKGIDPALEKQIAKQASYSFKELAVDFKKRHLPNLRPRSRDEYKRIIDIELIPIFKKIAADNLSRSHIIRLLDNIAIDRNSPTLANRVRAVLSSIYSFGVDRAVVEINPVLHVKRVTGEKKRDRIYSEEEIRALWKAFEAQEEPLQSLFKMLLICGQRSAETRNMKWSDINNGIWCIPEELTKAGRSHFVPLPHMAVQVLDHVYPFTGKKEFVFASNRADGPIQWMTKAKDRIRKMEKVPNDFRPHDLRRSAASYMAKLGVDRTILGKVLNHAGLAGDHSVTAIYDRYQYQEEKKQALNRWSFELSQIIEGSERDAKVYKIG